MDWDKLRIFHAVADAGASLTLEKPCVFLNRQLADKYDRLRKSQYHSFPQTCSWTYTDRTGRTFV